MRGSANVWRVAFLLGVAAAAVALSASGRVETRSTIEIGSALQITGGVCQTPAAQTWPATTIGPFGATLNGGAGGAFWAWFDYGLTPAYGNSTPVFGFPGLCYGGYSITVSDLTCSTPYHFRAVVQGYGGIAYGDDAVFTTLPCPAPTVVTGAASAITSTAATLNGTANPNDLATDAYFQYGLTASYGGVTPAQSLDSGRADVAIGGGSVSGLACSTLYHFRAVASNSVGATQGLDATFTTSACPLGTSAPIVMTGAATGIASTTATLNGVTNPNGSAANAYFEYGRTSGYGSMTPPQNIGTGTASVTIAGGSVGFLRCNTQYHFRVKATNTVGTTDGADATFTTGGCPASPLDFDGDGTSDLAVFRPGTATWKILNSSSGFSTSTSLALGAGTDVPAAGDFDGDGKVDPAVFRPSDGTWRVLLSSNNFANLMTVGWGQNGDVPVPGDFDGDHLTDFAVYRPSTGFWYILLSSTGYSAYSSVPWGLSTDVPVPGDYDGDGKTDVAVYRPSTGMWHVLQSGHGFASVAYTFGMSFDVPVPGDYDGDGRTDVAIYRPGAGAWQILLSGSGFTTSVSYMLGDPEDIAVPGDYDGDRQTDIAVFRPTTGDWVILKSSTGYADSMMLSFGAWGSTPVPNADVQYVRNPTFTVHGSDVMRTSDFDGDRRSDITVFRPSTGTWYTLRSTSNFTTFSHLEMERDPDFRAATGDFDGDGLADPVLYDPTGNNWRVLMSSTGQVTTLQSGYDNTGHDSIPEPGDYDGDGKTDTASYHLCCGSPTGWWSVEYSSTGRSSSSEFRIGAEGDVPAAADYDGDGKMDPAVFSPSTGMWQVLLSSKNFEGILSIAWGTAGDIPVPADYDGDGKADFAVYRPSTGTWWVLNSSTGRQTYFSVVWGVNSDIPVPGDFDGDRKADIAVYRPDSGIWFILNSSGGYSYAATTVINWGTGGDIPILRRP